MYKAIKYLKSLILGAMLLVLSSLALNVNATEPSIPTPVLKEMCVDAATQQAMILTILKGRGIPLDALIQDIKAEFKAKGLPEGLMNAVIEMAKGLYSDRTKLDKEFDGVVTECMQFLQTKNPT
jgi:hypothetical protein